MGDGPDREAHAYGAAICDGFMARSPKKQKLFTTSSAVCERISLNFVKQSIT
jgi:hypothetical protein